MSSDYSELLHELSAHSVEFLVVGAHALAVYGPMRATKDLDVWVRPTPENAARVVEALRSFGAPLQGLTDADLSTPGVVFQIGIDPVRVDILTAIDGVEFEDAWVDRQETSFEGERVNVLSRDHLIRNKRASGRLQDLADVESLEKGS